MEKKCGTRLCAPALGMAFGIASGLSMMLLAWAGMWWGYGNTFIDQYALVFHGYAPTIIGGLWGGLWGLIEGFVFGVVIGAIYNCIARCCGCACCTGDKSSKSCK